MLLFFDTLPHSHLHSCTLSHAQPHPLTHSPTRTHACMHVACQATTVREGINGSYGMEELLFKHGVDVYVNGHEHSWERTYPIYKGKFDQSYDSPKVRKNTTTHFQTLAFTHVHCATDFPSVTITMCCRGMKHNKPVNIKDVSPIATWAECLNETLLVSM